MTDQEHEIAGKDDSNVMSRGADLKTAIWVLFLGVWSAFVLGIVTLMLGSPRTLLVCPIILEAAGAAGVMLGLARLFDSRTQAPRRIKHRVAALSVCIVGIMVFLVGFVGLRWLDMMGQIICGSQLSGLSKSLYVYVKPNGGYCPPERWCDVLVDSGFITERQLACPCRFSGRAHYAMNPNCEPNSPPDTVLLFETKGGWNQYGGAELLTFDNHRPKGANVLFNDGSIQFIRPKDVGKLKWRPEDANSVR